MCVFLTPQRAAAPAAETTLRHLLKKHGLAAVDNSGSTAGAPLDTARHFVLATETGTVVLWNSVPERPVALADVCWTSRGLTVPSAMVVSLDPRGQKALLFMTDGQVGAEELRKLQKTVEQTLHMVMVCVIFSSRPPLQVRDVNVSVFMSHFAAADQALLLSLSPLSGADDPDLRLLAIRGDAWSAALPGCPALRPDAPISSFPAVSYEGHLAPLPCVERPPLPLGALPLGDGRLLDTWALLSCPKEEFAAALASLSTDDRWELARVNFTRGSLRDWTKRLNDALASVDGRAAAEAQIGEPTANALLGRLHALIAAGHGGSASANALREQLRRAFVEGAARERGRTIIARDAAREVRAALNCALKACTAVEKAERGSLAELGVLSNRAMRAEAVKGRRLQLSELDHSGAPLATCDVLFDEGVPVGAMLACMVPDRANENTGDFVLDSPLYAGTHPRNALIENGLYGLPSRAADEIERSGFSPPTRTSTVVCLPFVPLSSASNLEEVHCRLCEAFTMGLRMEHVWGLAVGAAWAACERPWALAGTPMGEMLRYFIGQVMQHVPVAATHRLNIDRAPAAYSRLIARALDDPALTQHTPFCETAVMLCLLWLHRGRETVTDDAITGAMMARLATVVAQSHLAWRKAQSKAGCKNLWDHRGATSSAALTATLYETRVAACSGRLVPIVGTARLVRDGCDLERLLPMKFLSLLRAYCATASLRLESFCTPALTIAVFATLEKVVCGSMSDAAAVGAVRQIAAAELSTAGCRMATEAEALEVLRLKYDALQTKDQYVPRFATPYGQSVLFFDIGDGKDAAVAYMLAGHSTGAPKSDADWTALVEHIRAERGLLMQREYATEKDGSFTPATRTTAFARTISETYARKHAQGAALEDLSDANKTGEFVHDVVSALVSRAGKSAGNIHHAGCEQIVLALLPSLLECVARFGPPSYAGDRKGVPLVTRLRLELGERDPASLTLEDAPAVVAVGIEEDEAGKLAALRVALKLRASARTAAGAHSAVFSSE